MTPAGALVRGRLLVRASHPGPTAAVTALTLALAAGAGLRGGVLAVVAVAVVAGQVGVGWSNDLIDRHRDRVAGRPDKPVAAGLLDPRTVRVALASSLAVCAVASLLLGARPGLLHLGLVAVAWTYNLGLKATRWSWLPYAVCFALLPAVVHLAAPAPSWPPGRLVVAGALLGVGAHLVNAVPDLRDDARTGVHGLPQRLGRRRSLDVATVLLLAGSAVTVLGPPGAPGPGGLAVLVAVALVTVAGRLAGGRWAFRAALVVAGVSVAGLVLAV